MLGNPLFEESEQDEQPILLHHYIEGGGVMFTISHQPEICIYGYNIDSDRIASKIYLIDTIRENLLFALMLSPDIVKYNTSLKDRFEKYFDLNIINKIPWLKFYKALEEKKNPF